MRMAHALPPNTLILTSFTGDDPTEDAFSGCTVALPGGYAGYEAAVHLPHE
ncbi:TPA: hypothetical protein ACH3X3_014810 [Trebouxia sp. C0006]